MVWGKRWHVACGRWQVNQKNKITEKQSTTRTRHTLVPYPTDPSEPRANECWVFHSTRAGSTRFGLIWFRFGLICSTRFGSRFSVLFCSALCYLASFLSARLLPLSLPLCLPLPLVLFWVYVTRCLRLASSCNKTATNNSSTNKNSLCVHTYTHA